MVLPDVIDAFVELAQAKVGSGIEVSALDLSEDGPPNAIWLGECESEFQWRSLGQAATNRTEHIVLPFFVRVYREGPKQRDAGREARARCAELAEMIEAAIVEDPTTPFRISNTVTFSRLAGFKISTKQADNGWIALGRGRIEAKNYP